VISIPAYSEFTALPTLKEKIKSILSDDQRNSISRFSNANPAGLLIEIQHLKRKKRKACFSREKESIQTHLSTEILSPPNILFSSLT